MGLCSLIGSHVAQPADPILCEVASLEVLQPALSHEQRSATHGAGEVILAGPPLLLVLLLLPPKVEGVAVHAVLLEGPFLSDCQSFSGWIYQLDDCIEHFISTPS